MKKNLLLLIGILFINQSFAQIKLPTIETETKAPVKQTTTTNVASGKLTLKVTTDADCYLKIDGISQGRLNAGGEVKFVYLTKGKYKFYAQSVANSNDVFEDFKEVTEVNYSDYYEINLQSIINLRVAAENMAIKLERDRLANEKRNAEEQKRADEEKTILEAKRRQEIDEQLAAEKIAKAKKTAIEAALDEERARKDKENELNADVKSIIASFDDDFIYVKGGDFNMGCLGLGYCPEDEQPSHWVNLDGYYISKFEVTQAQWRAVMGINPSKFKGCDQCPVENVGWEDVQKFLSKLNSLAGKIYRLPTEAEWEYAARGRKKIIEDDFVAGSYKKKAWYKDNSGGETHPVGQKEKNELGLYDMLGNVSELCNDKYSKTYYNQSPEKNPQGPAEGENRVVRGCSWRVIDYACRVTTRSYLWELENYGSATYIGIRLARDKK